MNERPSIADRPNSIPWPPLLLLSGIFAGFLLGRYILPTGELPLSVRLFGYALLAAGLTIDVSALVTLWRARTNILPHRAADRLITTGPYRFSRNPIYLGNSVSLAAAAFAFSNLWYLLAAMLVSIFVDRLAIRREEAHLAARFGSDWKEYARKTARWLF